VSFTYTSKKHNETARHTLLTGINYQKLLQKSIEKLQRLIPTFRGIKRQAADEVLASLQKSLEAHKAGTQSDDYTKKGQYAHVANGVNINLNDNSIQVFGLAHRKVVLVPGVYPPVNSRPLTIAKNEVRDLLPISKFREFALDAGVILQGKSNGRTYECAEPDHIGSLYEKRESLS
jgi:hypothetical protein